MFISIVFGCFFSLASIFMGFADPVIMYFVGLAIGISIYSVKRKGLRWFKEFI